jgi:hypothetical protein
MEPKLSLKDLVYCLLRLIELLRKNANSCKKKLLEEIGQSLPQNVKWAISSELVLA